MGKELHLRINPKFRLLVAPLAEKDRQLLENQSVARGASPPIYVWDNTILIDYEIYSFCRSQRIPLNISELRFQYSEEAIIWICKNQSQRTDLLEAREKYLVGKQFQAEKDVDSGIITPDFVKHYIDRINVSTEGNIINLEITLFSGIKLNSVIEKNGGRSGTMVKKMIEAYENGMK